MVEWLLGLEFFALGLIVIGVLGVVAICIVILYDYKDIQKDIQKRNYEELESICGKMS